MPLDYVSTWQDDNDGNGSFQIYAKASDGSFSQITVNDEASGNQVNPKIGTAANGDFVVVWEDDTDNNGSYQIMARGFYANGTERFAQMTVNSVADGQQLKPDIAMNAAGDFVVIWEDDQDKKGISNILGRGFTADGTERFSDRTVANTGDGSEQDPAIAMAENGDFVVVWSDDSGNDGFYQIHARGFDQNGNSKFPRFTVNSDPAGQQITPDIAMTSNGDFVVVWSSDGNHDWMFETYVRGFYADGSVRFSDNMVNQICSACMGSRYNPTIGIEDDGRFLAVWVDRGLRIWARQYYANGMPANDKLLINENESLLQNRPIVDVGLNGDVIILWDELTNNQSFNIKASRLDINGNLGPEILLSTVNNGDQFSAAVGVR